MLTNLDATLALTMPSDRELLITRTFAAPSGLCHPYPTPPCAPVVWSLRSDDDRLRN